MGFQNAVISRNQQISVPGLAERGISIHVKREDEIHPEISGNKWRKLRHHAAAIVESGETGILTYGGAYSNHIAATAALADSLGVKCIGVIRGEEVLPLNETLARAAALGMDLHYVSRARYRGEKQAIALEIDANHRYHTIPEGGADELGVKGCEEILTEQDKKDFDIICCSAGTGTTAAGIARSMRQKQTLRVYPALKGDFMKAEIQSWVDVSDQQLKVTSDYHFGGYAKVSLELIDFMRKFHQQTEIKLDPVYTSKLMYGVMEDLQSGDIPENSRVLVIHTGGLQGIAGMEQREGLTIYPD